MTYTRHGHHIEGTAVETQAPTSVARCGGPKLCKSCAHDAELAKKWGWMVGEPTNFVERAKNIVSDYVRNRQMSQCRDSREEFEKFDVYVVWFAKTLQNWKALISTTLPDGMYYEVTYNGEKQETYLDAYTKIKNIVIPD